MILQSFESCQFEKTKCALSLTWIISKPKTWTSHKEGVMRPLGWVYGLVVTSLVPP
jgi:hypothetical protein